MKPIRIDQLRNLSCNVFYRFGLQACDAVLASKDAVINEIIAELKFKDEEYQIAIEQQAKDINDLCTIMARQVRRGFSSFSVKSLISQGRHYHLNICLMHQILSKNDTLETLIRRITYLDSRLLFFCSLKMLKTAQV